VTRGCKKNYIAVCALYKPFYMTQLQVEHLYGDPRSPNPGYALQRNPFFLTPTTSSNQFLPSLPELL
jgi:hypothetical protein